MVHALRHTGRDLAIVSLHGDVDCARDGGVADQSAVDPVSPLFQPDPQSQAQGVRRQGRAGHRRVARRRGGALAQRRPIAGLAAPLRTGARGAALALAVRLSIFCAAIAGLPMSWSTRTKSKGFFAVWPAKT